MKQANIPSNNRKKKGELILYAVNQDGRTTHVNDAIPHQNYWCPTCSARMYPTHKKRKYYALCPCETHNSAMCVVGMVHDITLTDPNAFFANLYTETQPQKPGVQIIGPVRASHDGPYPCTSLKQIYQTGIFLFPPKDDLVAGYYLGDLVLTKSMLPHVMQEKQSLLNRIIYALPEYVDYARHTIRFAVLYTTSKEGNRITEAMRFLLAFGKHTKDFEHFRMKLFDSRGKSIQRPVVVAAEWHYHNHPHCFQGCGKTHCAGTTTQCVGLQTGTYHCRKQIYIPPERAGNSILNRTKVPG